MAPGELSPFAAWYSRFRGGRTFLIILAGWCVSWLFFHWLAQFDPGLDGYEAILSTEASLALGVLTMKYESDRLADLRWQQWQREQTEWQRRQIEFQIKQSEHMLEMMSATKDNSVAIRDMMVELLARNDTP